jgi:hypothetical protein
VVEIDTLGLAKRFKKRNRDDVWRLKRDHLTPFSLLHGFDGSATKAGRQEAIVTGGSAAPLKMPEDE